MAIDTLGLIPIKWIKSLPNFGEQQEPTVMGENWSSHRGHMGQGCSRHFEYACRGSFVIWSQILWHLSVLVTASISIVEVTLCSLVTGMLFEP